MTAGNREADTNLTLAQAGLSIDVSGLQLEFDAPGHHGYQRACDLISGAWSQAALAS